MTDQELIQALTESGNSDKFIRRADYWAMCCREAASRLAALQAENGSKDKEIERWKEEAEMWRVLRADADRIREGMMEKEVNLISKNVKLEAALSRVEAERDAAVECIADIEDDLDRGSDNDWAREHIAEWRGAQGV